MDMFYIALIWGKKKSVQEKTYLRSILAKYSDIQYHVLCNFEIYCLHCLSLVIRSLHIYILSTVDARGSIIIMKKRILFLSKKGDKLFSPHKAKRDR